MAAKELLTAATSNRSRNRTEKYDLDHQLNMISYWFSLSTDRWREKSEKRAIIYDIPCMNHHKISISERCAKSKFPMEDSNSSLWLHFIHLIIVFRCSNENHMKTFRCRVLYALLWKCDWNSLLDNRMHRISLSLI